jgi:hypothetical protein
MTLSVLLIRVAFLALPGILAIKVYHKLRGRGEQRTWEQIIEIMLFALASYFLYGLVVELTCGFPPSGASSPTTAVQKPAVSPMASIDAFCDEKLPLAWRNIFFACMVGLLLGVVAAYLHKYGLVNRFGRLIRATKRTGDEDTWQAFLDNKAVNWAFVRDHKLNLVYYGFIRNYSDSGKDRELVLENVGVFANDTGEHLYDTAAMYISRKTDDMSIEIVEQAG